MSEQNDEYDIEEDLEICQLEGHMWVEYDDWEQCMQCNSKRWVKRSKQ